MKFIASLIRWPIGRLILLLNAIFSPKSVKRSSEQQQLVDEKTKNLTLYQLPACPFCVKVRRAMKRNNLTIALRNINQNNAYLDELIKEGGKRTVPCLRIDNNGNTEWLYESNDIISYLEKLAKN
jgi:glutaredoxin